MAPGGPWPTSLELLESECRSAERRLKAAKLPKPKGLDPFDFAPAPSVHKPMVLGLMRCEHVAHRENLLLVGASATGKSYLATALHRSRAGRGVAF